MNPVEIIKNICKDKKISIHKLESECGFANGYIGQLRKGVMPYERLQKVAEFLEVDVHVLLGEETKKAATVSGDSSRSDMEDMLIQIFRQLPQDRRLDLLLEARRLLRSPKDD